MSDHGEQRSHASLALFRDRFGMDDRSLVAGLETALNRGVDHADLFFEYTTRSSVALEEGIVKTGGHHVEQGVGVRVQSGERQGYAHSDEIDVDSVKIAGAAALAISEGPGSERALAIEGAGAPALDLYPVATDPTEVPAPELASLLEAIDRRARRDPRIVQVMASLSSENRHLLVTASDGTLVGDVQPLVVLRVSVIAESGGRRETAGQGMGGRYEIARLLDAGEWHSLVDEAVRIATLNLESEPCPAGVMNVVLGPGWPGILPHEAIGHGLEGDFNRRGTSVFSGRIGERVASPGVTVIDDGTIEARRGSLNVDDEGTPTARTTLIEDGILVGYMHDRLNARLMGHEPTGNGRRESYRHLPMPRMTNTFMLAGQDDPDDIVRSVDNGIYAASFSGGQVDITNGKFVFSCNEAYRIEGGRLGAPLRGAMLIGSGADALTRVKRIGNDLKLDRGIGTCGKDGQGVPVGVGLPTIRIDDLTVGGTEG